uniref:Uncharacterized protein n=1 Tax=Romanomermis culicivorax TaxID=13658 RepID=A0A915JG38_ROMCU
MRYGSSATQNGHEYLGWKTLSSVKQVIDELSKDNFDCSDKFKLLHCNNDGCGAGMPKFCITGKHREREKL